MGILQAWRGSFTSGTFSDSPNDPAIHLRLHSSALPIGASSYPWDRGNEGMMEPAEDIELLELLFVDLGPLQEGFAGVLIKVYRCGDRYVLLKTRVLVFEPFLQPVGARELYVANTFKETDYLLGSIWPFGISVGSLGVTTRPRMAQPIDDPLLHDYVPLRIVIDVSDVAVALRRLLPEGVDRLVGDTVVVRTVVRVIVRLRPLRERLM